MPDAMTQVKFTIESDIVSAFKSRCAAVGVSMASEVREFMKVCQPVKALKAGGLTRPTRRKAVTEIIGTLNGILDSETTYRDNIPEMFAQRHKAADNACDRLSEAISCLEDAF